MIILVLKKILPLSEKNSNKMQRIDNFHVLNLLIPDKIRGNSYSLNLI